MPLPPQIVVATSNAHKITEIAAIIGSLGSLGVSLIGLDDAAPGLSEPVETGVTFAENARIKALYYAAAIGKPCLSDDSGLCVNALGGAPGIYSSRYADDDPARIARLLKELAAAGAVTADERHARFVCAACIAYPDGRCVEAEGLCEGVIARSPSGHSGFGYDPIFYLPEFDKTMAELPGAEKNNVSHRRKAIARIWPLVELTDYYG